MKVSTLTAIVLFVGHVTAATVVSHKANAVPQSLPKVVADKFSAQDLNCMTKVIYHESRGEIKTGQIAVGYSVMNRVADRRFPNNVCDVVFAKSQYSDIDKAKFDKQSDAWKNSKVIAKIVLNGEAIDPTNGARFYYNPKTANPYWKNYAEGHKVVIGNHKFLYNVKNK